MKRIEDCAKAYTFDDVVLVPNYSQVKSRKDPSVRIEIGGFYLDVPVISAPMNTVTETEMSTALSDIGGCSVIHRFMSIDKEIEQAKSTINLEHSPFMAIGANYDFEDRSAALINAGVRRFCIDIANGHSEHCISAVKTLRKLAPSKTLIMAGNVCTEDGARRLAEAGANLIRIGVGPGAVCRTREVTGHGVPQLTAIQNCYNIKKDFPEVVLIADGGVRNSGDITKAIAGGADVVMIGSLLAGTTESPGEIIEESGRLLKYYNGMASTEGRKSWFDRDKSGFVPEGISIKIPYLGRSAKKVIEGLVGGLKVGMSYSGAHNLSELREKARWAIVSPAGYIEGTPHGISRT